MMVTQEGHSPSENNQARVQLHCASSYIYWAPLGFKKTPKKTWKVDCKWILAVMIFDPFGGCYSSMGWWEEPPSHGYDQWARREADPIPSYLHEPVWLFVMWCEWTIPQILFSGTRNQSSMAEVVLRKRRFPRTAHRAENRNFIMY